VNISSWLKYKCVNCEYIFREMTKDTQRDRVWKVVLELSAMVASGKKIPREWVFENSKFETDDVTAKPIGRFTKHDVAQRVDVSERTVHDVLDTAVSYGFLDSRDGSLGTLPTERHNKGYYIRRGITGYRPPEGKDKDQDSSEPDTVETDSLDDVDASEIAALKQAIGVSD
jgi:hypothetical protein